jgi:hypothetical protein
MGTIPDWVVTGSQPARAVFTDGSRIYYSIDNGPSAGLRVYDPNTEKTAQLNSIAGISQGDADATWVYFIVNGTLYIQSPPGCSGNCFFAQQSPYTGITKVIATPAKGAFVVTDGRSILGQLEGQVPGSTVSAWPGLFPLVSNFHIADVANNATGTQGYIADDNTSSIYGFQPSPEATPMPVAMNLEFTPTKLVFDDTSIYYTDSVPTKRVSHLLRVSRALPNTVTVLASVNDVLTSLTQDDKALYFTTQGNAPLFGVVYRLAK